MKIKRFFAADMRQALRQVKEVLGADAVILSNKSVEGGVELVAAKDYDEDAFFEEQEAQAREQDAAATPEPKEERPAGPPKIARPAPVIANDSAQPNSSISAKPHQSTVTDVNQDAVLTEMRREMAQLRRMMENELSGLYWRDMNSRRPAARELMRRLIAMEISPALCRRLVDQMDELDDVEQTWRMALNHLSSALEVVDEDLLETGGVIAVIGPTGVGKTTTIAKLAARYCLQHGHHDLALITTDHYRIGAQEQLHTYARILDVPVRSANTIEELNAALNTFSSKRLVLIDTAGVGPRDVRLAEQISLLTSGHKPIRTLLALSATTQLSALDQAADMFNTARPDGCVLTKVDEAASLGSALSVLIQRGLPLAYITDGQKVPEDLRLGRANLIVSQAASLMPGDDGPEYSEDYLALTLGGSRDHVHV